MTTIRRTGAWCAAILLTGSSATAAPYFYVQSARASASTTISLNLTDESRQMWTAAPQAWSSCYEWNLRTLDTGPQSFSTTINAQADLWMNEGGEWDTTRYLSGCDGILGPWAMSGVAHAWTDGSPGGVQGWSGTSVMQFEAEFEARGEGLSLCMYADWYSGWHPGLGFRLIDLTSSNTLVDTSVTRGEWWQSSLELASGHRYSFEAINGVHDEGWGDPLGQFSFAFQGAVVATPDGGATLVALAFGLGCIVGLKRMRSGREARGS